MSTSLHPRRHEAGRGGHDPSGDSREGVRHDGLDLVVLDPVTDPASEDPERRALVAAYGDVWSRAFLEGAMTDEQRDLWLEHSAVDRARFRAAVPTRSAVGGLRPVATFTSWAGRMNVGGPDLLGVRMITDVTVAPTHRRRGIFARLMADDLDDAAAAGLPLAALTVSEGGIYGRFGFAPATRTRRVEVDTRPGRLRLRPYDDSGSLEAVTPADAWPVVERLFAHRLAATRGEVDRPGAYRQVLTGRFDWAEGSGPDRTLNAVLHLNPDGTPDGYALYRLKESDGEGRLTLIDLVALTPGCYLRLWDFLAGIDLVTQVSATLAHDDPLDHAVLDPRAIRTTGVRDMLWVRLLDLPAALEGRPWREDGSVVLDVADPHGHLAGRWRVAVRAGRAVVERTEEAAGVVVDAETLATLYLGDRRVAPLAAAGRVTGRGVATLAAMMDDAAPLPDCRTGF